MEVAGGWDETGRDRHWDGAGSHTPAAWVQSEGVGIREDLRADKTHSPYDSGLVKLVTQVAELEDRRAPVTAQTLGEKLFLNSNLICHT